MHDGFARGCRRIEFGNRRAVAHHGDAVADGENLVETMGNHDGGDTVGLLGPEYLKKALGLAAIERRRRLVHDHQAGILGEDLEDFDELALIGRQIADNRIRLQPVARHAVKQRDQPGRLGLQRLAVDKDATFRLAAEKDIVGDGELRDEAQLLIKQGDTGIFGVARAFEPHVFTIEPDGAAGRRDRARNDLAERALAAAIGAQKRVNFTATNRQPAVGKRAYRAKILRYAGRFQSVRHRMSPNNACHRRMAKARSALEIVVRAGVRRRPETALT